MTIYGLHNMNQRFFKVTSSDYNNLTHEGITERFRIWEVNLVSILLPATSFNKDEVHTSHFFKKDVFKVDVLYQHEDISEIESPWS